tara:strand:+ start:1604 stop:2848 length:1245 start_codon:yes stop_codon:yes gene_type:complete
MPVGPYPTFDACVIDQVKKGSTKLAAQKICGEIEKKSQGRETMKKQILNFVVPIENSYSRDDEFLIKGTAINSTTTRNGVKYTSEELSKSANTLKNKPILKDHKNSVDNIVGRTTNSYFENEKVVFEGRIVDEEIRQKIQQGLITSVSVGAMVEEVPYEEDESGEFTGTVLAKGIDFVELSLVAIPADPEAGLSQAILNSLKTEKKEADLHEVEGDRKFINDLPDSANNTVDIPHLRNALARAPQTKISMALRKKAIAHLEAHAKELLKTNEEEQIKDILMLITKSKEEIKMEEVKELKEEVQELKVELDSKNEVAQTEVQEKTKEPVLTMEQMFEKISDLVDDKFSKLKENKKEEAIVTKGEVGEASTETEQAESNGVVVGYDTEGLCKGLTVSKENYDNLKRLSRTNKYEWE